MTALFITLTILLWGFIGTIVALYGVLPSLSDSYRELPEKYRDYIFTFVFFGISMSAVLLSASAYMMFAAFGFSLIAVAPKFWDSAVKPVHFAGAGIAALFSQLHVGIALGLWPLNIVFLIACLLITVFRAKNHVWWLEMACFASFYIAICLYM